MPKCNEIFVYFPKLRLNGYRFTQKNRFVIPNRIVCNISKDPKFTNKVPIFTNIRVKPQKPHLISKLDRKFVKCYTCVINIVNSAEKLSVHYQFYHCPSCPNPHYLFGEMVIPMIEINFCSALMKR